jgi:hypothetical protein
MISKKRAYFSGSFESSQRMRSKKSTKLSNTTPSVELECFIRFGVRAAAAMRDRLKGRSSPRRKTTTRQQFKSGFYVDVLVQSEPLRLSFNPTLHRQGRCTASFLSFSPLLMSDLSAIESNSQFVNATKQCVEDGWIVTKKIAQQSPSLRSVVDCSSSLPPAPASITTEFVKPSSTSNLDSSQSLFCGSCDAQSSSATQVSLLECPNSSDIPPANEESNEGSSKAIPLDSSMPPSDNRRLSTSLVSIVDSQSKANSHVRQQRLIKKSATGAIYVDFYTFVRLIQFSRTGSMDSIWITFNVAKFIFKNVDPISLLKCLEPRRRRFDNAIAELQDYIEGGFSPNGSMSVELSNVNGTQPGHLLISFQIFELLRAATKDQSFELSKIRSGPVPVYQLVSRRNDRSVFFLHFAKFYPGSCDQFYTSYLSKCEVSSTTDTFLGKVFQIAVHSIISTIPSSRIVSDHPTLLEKPTTSLDSSSNNSSGMMKNGAVHPFLARTGSIPSHNIKSCLLSDTSLPLHHLQSSDTQASTRPNFPSQHHLIIGQSKESFPQFQLTQTPTQPFSQAQLTTSSQQFQAETTRVSMRNEYHPLMKHFKPPNSQITANEIHSNTKAVGAVLNSTSSSRLVNESKQSQPPQMVPSKLTNYFQLLFTSTLGQPLGAEIISNDPVENSEFSSHRVDSDCIADPSKEATSIEVMSSLNPQDSKRKDVPRAKKANFKKKKSSGVDLKDIDKTVAHEERKSTCSMKKGSTSKAPNLNRNPTLSEPPKSPRNLKPKPSVSRKQNQRKVKVNKRSVNIKSDPLKIPLPSKFSSGNGSCNSAQLDNDEDQACTDVMKNSGISHPNIREHTEDKAVYIDEMASSLQSSEFGDFITALGTVIDNLLIVKSKNQSISDRSTKVAITKQDPRSKPSKYFFKSLKRSRSKLCQKDLLQSEQTASTKRRRRGGSYECLL